MLEFFEEYFDVPYPLPKQVTTGIVYGVYGMGGESLFWTSYDFLFVSI